MAKKCSSKAKAKTGTNTTGTITDIKENKPMLSGTSSSIDQPSKTIGKLICHWLTDKEASDILLQFRKACTPNHQVLWSGMLRATAQQWADTHGFQTLTTSLGPLLQTDNPDCFYYQKTKKNQSNYIHGASIVFAWFISHGDLVTVLSQPPPQRFHPTGQSFYQLYEEPIIKGLMGNRPVTKIVVAHPTIQSAADFMYEMWPHDEFSLWIESFGMQDILIYWRQVKITKTTAQLSVTAPIFKPSASTIKPDVVESCGSLATSYPHDLKYPKSLMISETDNIKQLWMSPNTEENVKKKYRKDKTSSEINQAIGNLARKPTFSNLELFIAAGLDRIKVEARGKQKKTKKARKSRDKKSKENGLSPSETSNDLQEITIEKLVRDDSSMSLKLLIDAAYGRIEIEVGESMEEQKERKKAEQRDKKMVKRMKKKESCKNSLGYDKSDGVQKITIEMLVRDETSESLQLLIDAAYGRIKIEIGESTEEKKERMKREKEDRRIVLEMKRRIKKKEKEELSEKTNKTKESDEECTRGGQSNTEYSMQGQGKARAKKLERKRAKTARIEEKTIKGKKKRGFLGKKLYFISI